MTLEKKAIIAETENKKVEKLGITYQARAQQVII